MQGSMLGPQNCRNINNNSNNNNKWKIVFLLQVFHLVSSLNPLPPQKLCTDFAFCLELFPDLIGLCVAYRSGITSNVTSSWVTLWLHYVTFPFPPQSLYGHGFLFSIKLFSAPYGPLPLLGWCSYWDRDFCVVFMAIPRMAHNKHLMSGCWRNEQCLNSEFSVENTQLIHFFNPLPNLRLSKGMCYVRAPILPEECKH